MSGAEEVNLQEDTSALTGVAVAEKVETVEVTKEEDGLPEIPEGFNEHTYDRYKQEYKPDGIKEQMAKLEDERAKFEKQALDMRRTISKGKAPEKTEEYLKDFEPEERFAKFYDSENENNAEVLGHVDGFLNVAKDNALNPEQVKNVLNFFNEFSEKTGILDTRTTEQIALEQQDFKNAEYEKLATAIGEDATEVDVAKMVDNEVRWVQNISLFNEDQKTALVGLMNQGAVGVSIVHSIHRALGGGGMDIPTNEVIVGDLGTDAQLRAEYNNPSTTSERRVEIIKQRTNAGRRGSF